MKVCPNCFSDQEIKVYIENNSNEIGQCSICQSTADTKIISIEELDLFFIEFFSLFLKVEYGRPINELILSDWTLFTDIKVTNAIINSVLNRHSLRFSNSNDKVTYIASVEIPVEHWKVFKHEIMWNKRYTSSWDELIDLKWDYYFSFAIELNTTQTYYRARIHDSVDQEQYKESEMGAPPPDCSKEGRANPIGIPYLYLCDNIETTLHEVRAITGDVVSIGEFKVISSNPIRIVDFTEDDSLFRNEDGLRDYVSRVLLKKQISRDLSKPMRRYDSVLEYVPTQYICEFVKYISNVDGVQFESSLNPPGKNIVLFDQSLVKCIVVTEKKIFKQKLIF